MFKNNYMLIFLTSKITPYSTYFENIKGMHTHAHVLQSFTLLCPENMNVKFLVYTNFSLYFYPSTSVFYF